MAVLERGQRRPVPQSRTAPGPSYGLCTEEVITKSISYDAIEQKP